MARLNDAPPQPSADSVEALKRRFLRQNREIARVNSTQSLRIRTLESEVSRLLAENLTLQEQIIDLGTDNQRLKDAQKSQNAFLEARNLLVQKLKEVEALVGELGPGSTSDGDNTHPGQRRRSSGFQRRVEQRNSSRGGASFGELLAAQEGRLPMIVEDKHFPRKTMDVDDFVSIAGTAGSNSEPLEAGSPELGPPPIAHLDFENIGSAHSDDLTKTSDTGVIETESRSAVAKSTSDVRRRRRDSSLVKDLSNTKASTEEMPVENDSNSASKELRMPLKSGAKRKLSVRDDEAKSKADEDSFQYTRRVVNDKSSDVSRPIRVLATGRVRPMEASSDGRSALGPKSTNSAPTSPIKGRNASAEKLNKPETAADIAKDIIKQTHRALREGQDENENVKEVSLGKPRKSFPTSKPKTIEIPADAAKTDGDENSDGGKTKLPPKTPATHDILSPPSTEAEHLGPSRDTPPPGLETYPATTGPSSLSAAARPSRRQRAAVSYAEPNLRDKMRRPGKQFLDAVISDKKPVSSAMPPASTESEEARIKQEPSSAELVLNNIPEASGKHPDFKEPVSPLSKKSTSLSAKLPEPSALERRRKSLLAPEHKSQDQTTSSGAANVISALALAGGARPKREADADNLEPDNSVQQENESVFDPPSSSPARSTSQSAKTLLQMRSAKATSSSSAKERRSTASSTAATTSTTRERQLARVNRRHSTNPSLTDVTSTEALAMKLASTSLASRTNRRKKDEGEVTNDSDVESALTKLQGSFDGPGDKFRTASLRASSRRRSMMI